MTPHERDLTPEEEDEVSRLLADVGGRLEAPPEVVARLDDVLAGLVADRAAADPTPAAEPAGAPVVPLEEERRRRRWPRVLLAAAAVTAGGYGVGVLLPGTTMSGGDSGTSADASAGADTEAGGGSAAESQAEGARSGSPAPVDPQLLKAPVNATLEEPAPRLDPAHLGRDVRRLLADQGPRVQADEGAALLRRPEDRALVACLPPTLGPDDAWYLVRYAGTRAALVAAAHEDGTVRASVVDCDGQRLDSVTVPAP